MTIKERIKKWLGLYDLKLEVFADMDLEIKNEMSKLTKEMESWKALVGVGVDMHVMSNSWAVVCIAGKQEIVQFVDLDKNDYDRLNEFLRFARKHTNRLRIDAHPLMKL